MSDRGPEQQLSPTEQARAMGEAFATAMGTPRPERQLENFEKYEEHGEEFHIKPGTELPFMVLYTDEQYEIERKKWEYRSILSTARARKNDAGSVDSVTNPSPEERGLDPLGVEMKKERLDYLWREMPGLLAATCVYTEITGGPEFVGYMPNERKTKPEIKLLSVREKLLGVEITNGVRIAKVDAKGKPVRKGKSNLILKRIMEWKEIAKDYSKGELRKRGEKIIVEDDWVGKNTLDWDKLKAAYKGDKIVGGVYTEEEIAGLKHEQAELGDGKRDKNGLLVEPKCPDSVYDSPEPAFSVLRNSLRFFLKTKAVDFLFSDEADREKILNPDLDTYLKEEKDNLDGENDPEKKKELQETYDENKKRLKRMFDEKKIVEITKRAREAEQAAWNFIYTMGIIEANNTPENNQYIRELKSKPRPLGPSNFMTLYLWMAMHPQIRFEAKVLRNKDGLDDAKENWASLGSWAANNIQKGSWRKPDLDSTGTQKKEPVYDDETGEPEVDASGNEVLKSVFKTEIPRFIRNDLVLDAMREEGGPRKALFGFFTKNGSLLLTDPSILESHKKLYTEMVGQREWKSLPDSPFVNYRFDRLRWANTIYSIFKKGPEATGKIPLPDLAEGARMMGLTQTEVMNLLIMLEGINANSPTISPAEGAINWAFDVNSMKRAQPDLFRDYSKEREYL